MLLGLDTDDNLACGLPTNESGNTVTVDALLRHSMPPTDAWAFNATPVSTSFMASAAREASRVRNNAHASRGGGGGGGCGDANASSTTAGASTPATASPVAPVAPATDGMVGASAGAGAGAGARAGTSAGAGAGAGAAPVADVPSPVTHRRAPSASPTSRRFDGRPSNMPRLTRVASYSGRQTLSAMRLGNNHARDTSTSTSFLHALVHGNGRRRRGSPHGSGSSGSGGPGGGKYSSDDSAHGSSHSRTGGGGGGGGGLGVTAHLSPVSVGAHELSTPRGHPRLMSSESSADLLRGRRGGASGANATFGLGGASAGASSGTQPATGATGVGGGVGVGMSNSTGRRQEDDGSRLLSRRAAYHLAWARTQDDVVRLVQRFMEYLAVRVDAEVEVWQVRRQLARALDGERVKLDTSKKKKKGGAAPGLSFQNVPGSGAGAGVGVIHTGGGKKNEGGDSDSGHDSDGMMLF